MKKQYEAIMINVFHISEADIIVTSGFYGEDDIFEKEEDIFVTSKGDLNIMT